MLKEVILIMRGELKAQRNEVNKEANKVAL